MLKIEEEARFLIRDLLAAQEYLDYEYLQSDEEVIYDYYWQVRNVRLEELVGFIKKLAGFPSHPEEDHVSWKTMPFSLTTSGPKNKPRGWK